MGQGVHADVVVGDVDAHGLLTHGRLVGVTRRLVVVGKRDDGRAVDLAVRVRRAVVFVRLLEVFGVHGDHGSLQTRKKKTSKINIQNPQAIQILHERFESNICYLRKRFQL